MPRIRDYGALRAIDDPAVVEILKTEGVTLDMTPTSNVKLMAVPSMGEHPIRQFMRAGINCTISTDDPMLFRNSLNGEYMALANDADFTRGDLVQLARNGFAVADLPTEKKQDQVFVSYTSSLGGYSPKVGLVPKKVPTSTSSTSLTEWLWPQLQRLRR